MLSIARLTSSDKLSSYLWEHANAAWYDSTPKHDYVWHVLYYDHGTKTPVWRAGLSLR